MAHDGRDEKGGLRSALDSALDEVLTVLRDVGRGDLTGRLVPRFDESHPVGALATSLNTMIEALISARTTAEKHHGELAERMAIVATQESAIRELSTPIIEVWEGVLCLPIVGLLDSVRAAEMTSSLLSTVVSKKASFTIIDITGIHIMDTGATEHFIRMARAVRLLGAQCVLSGVNPDVALTVVRMGVELTGLRTHRNMRDALRFCVRAMASRRSGVVAAAQVAKPQGLGQTGRDPARRA